MVAGALATLLDEGRVHAEVVDIRPHFALTTLVDLGASTFASTVVSTVASIFASTLVSTFTSALSSTFAVTTAVLPAPVAAHLPCYSSTFAVLQ